MHSATVYTETQLTSFQVRGHTKLRENEYDAPVHA